MVRARGGCTTTGLRVDPMPVAAAIESSSRIFAEILLGAHNSNPSSIVWRPRSTAHYILPPTNRYVACDFPRLPLQVEPTLP